MRDLVKKAESFITFDMPLQAVYISAQFASIHNQCKREFPNWNSSSTRQKLIAAYWLTHVLQHWLFIYSISALVVMVIKPSSITFYFPGLFLGGLFVLPVLLICHYWPHYSYNFLPKLEMVKEAFEAIQNQNQEKCRQAQLSNFSLSLIFYVFDKTSGINTLQCNDQSAEFLMRLYGVDKGSMKKNLELVLGKKRQLSARKYTEIHNRFDEACAFFEDLQFTKGIQILKELKMKFQPLTV